MSEFETDKQAHRRREAKRLRRRARDRLDVVDWCIRAFIYGVPITYLLIFWVFS